MSMRRRLENLEGRTKLRQRVPEGSSEGRARMVEHLDQLARLKRGELGPEEAARVEAMAADVMKRFASRRGEGGR